RFQGFSAVCSEGRRQQRLGALWPRRAAAPQPALRRVLVQGLAQPPPSPGPSRCRRCSTGSTRGLTHSNRGATTRRHLKARSAHFGTHPKANRRERKNSPAKLPATSAAAASRRIPCKTTAAPPAFGTPLVRARAAAKRKPTTTIWAT